MRSAFRVGWALVNSSGMQTVLFIHGAGVRGEAWFTSLNLVASKARKFLPDFKWKDVPGGIRSGRDCAEGVR